MAICNGFNVASWIVETIENMVSLSRESYSQYRLCKTVLSISGRTISFEPISKLVAETNFEENLPLYMWWMKLRPLIRVLSGSSDAKDEIMSAELYNEIFNTRKQEGNQGMLRQTDTKV
ncbi:ATP-dependent 6-phosphofructokinase [Elysia marginata]|uniref:ATP-dependent 6-phosphofructokinase n=1 Tax=Elysia marginata TaxID=1093978 RepID=A0AAV4I0N4_9GAST|nr:ATP-dependent 6-phosphofructokinase [Elysia marginata]